MKTEFNKEDSLQEIIKPYKRKWYWFAISILLMILLALFYIKTTAPVYEVVTKILIKDAKKSGNPADAIPGMEGLAGLTGFNSNTVENEMEVLASKKLLSQLVDELPLHCPIYVEGDFHNVELYKAESPIKIQVINEKPFGELPKKRIDISIKGNEITLNSEEFSSPLKTQFNKTVSLPFANIMFLKNETFNPILVKKLNVNQLFFTYTDKISLIDELQELVKVKLSNKDATVIDLSVNHNNIAKAKDLLNTLVVQYNLEAIDEKNTESEKTKQFIDDRVNLISRELGDVEKQKQDFKTANDLVDIPAQAGLELQTNAEAEKRKLELYTQLEINNMYSGYINKKGFSEILPTNELSGEGEGEASGNIASYNRLVTERNRLLENSTSEHPMVKTLNDEIRKQRTAIKESLDKNRSSIQSMINSISSLEGKSNTGMRKVPAQERIFRNIERQQQIKEELYLVLLKKREETAIMLAMSSNKARVLDVAYKKKKPVAPKKMISLGAALFLGFGIPFLIIFLRLFFNTKISDKKSVEKYTSLPVVAEIPHLKSQKNNLIQQNDVSALAESFRILATNINLQLPLDQKNHVLLITSSVKGEGKTLVSMNLALSLAKKERKVLLIGSDIRNPQLQRYRPEMKSAKGLTEFLYGTVSDLREIIHPSQMNEHCDFIYSGIIPPNPVELLDNGRYKVLLEKAKELYDYIIIDSAPLMPVTDTYVIAKLADMTLYIMRSEKTEKSYIEYADHTAAGKKLNKVNIVLNDVKAQNFGYGNQKGYGYNQDVDEGFFGKIKSWFRQS
ncbi:hypothetical protein ASG31_15815 [Chryseobacterium sp. Leaf404]|uniref:GumC family protein n=1 Tax=unclassified Chryseobacterium TaxID=2593645 RepID=UPI0006F258C1|nr:MULTISPECIES: polysaccharide biosynthesis tyrosine autokinase [unclassified Chryseobacterium]KQT15067.1 hypothetical protein ASG31_15815 [Chryseobacterium sp. Leaf404]